MTDTTQRKQHWDGVYAGRAADLVTWYQARPDVSLRLMAATGADKAQAVIDVGGGASTLVDHLLDAGYGDVGVLDVSRAALNAAKSRLGARADGVDWIAADITTWTPAPGRYAVWHDRAVLHFLTAPEDRRAYVGALERGLAPDGHVVIGTFAAWGPEKCSGLPTVRYDAGAMTALLGEGFRLIEQVDEDHVTPKGNIQAFSYFRLARA